MKKRIFFGVLAVVSMMAMALCVSLTQGLFPKTIFGEEKEYTMELNASNAPTSFDVGTYGREGTTTGAVVKGDYSLDMTYRLAKRENGYHVTLAPHGYMLNKVDSQNSCANRVTSLKTITVTYNSSNNITLRTSIRNDGREFGEPITVTSGTPINFNDYPYYFILEAGDSAAQISKVSLTYSCSENEGTYIADMAGTYSGNGSDGYVYKLTISGNSATIVSLNKQTNVPYTGSVETVGSNLTCSFNIQGNAGTYTSVVSSDHRVLTYSSKTGVCAGFPNIDFYKIYNVEDFERFSSQGQTYGGKVNNVQRTETSLFDMSGLRSQWHSDWYSSNSLPVSYFGNGDWKVMGSEDFLLYTSNKGHNSSKAAAFKGNSNGLRHIQMKAPLGIPNSIGKGAYLSLWAKAYSNSGLSTVKTTDSSIKIYAFYNEKVTSSNVGTRTEANISIPANSDWARYTIPLDSTKEYYSIGFYDNKGSTIYLVVDDIEIYTVNPYVEYIQPVAVTGVSVSPSNIQLLAGETSQLTAAVSPDNATNKNVTWSSSASGVATVDSNGLVTAVSGGTATITATTSDGGFTSTCSVSVTTPAAHYPSGTYKANVTVATYSYILVVSIGNQSNGLVGVKISTYDAGPTGITYNGANNTFTIGTTGKVSGYTVGNITGTYDYTNDRLINVNSDGQLSAAVKNLTLTKPTDTSTSKFNNCDGSTSTLQSTFKRRYNNGSWQVDTSNADRITSNTTEFVTGTGSVKRRGWNSGPVALNFNADFSGGITVKNIQYWVYNPSNKDIELRMWGYKAVNFGSNFETGSVTALANQWTYVGMGFTQAKIYNFQIADFNNTGVYLSFDDIYLFQ